MYKNNLFDVLKNCIFERFELQNKVKQLNYLSKGRDLKDFV